LPINDDLQKAFPLVSYLQPDRAVAVCVLIDAYDRVEVVRRGQERRPDTDRPYKLIIPEETLPQYCIYGVSEKWELDQESDCPRKEPGYRPTADDRVIRYIKTLALEAMDRPSRYAAVGLGCHLYIYRPKQISALAEDLFNSDNIRRDKDWMFKRLKRRFPGTCNGGGRVSLEAPSERQRALINQSLSVLAPWYSCQTASAPGPETTFLDTYFDKDSSRPELERVHALFDTACCGLGRLVREYNSSFPEWSKMRLDDPNNKLRVPKFSDGHGGPDGGEGDGGPPDPGERFNPSPLTPAEVASIRHILNRNQRRRRLYQPGELRVYVDGEATATLTRERASASLAVPPTASCVEVFGEDDGGELLLAVFPLSCLEPDGATLARELYVTHGGGQTFEISLSPAPVQSGDSSECVLRLEYRESREDAEAGAAADAHAASGGRVAPGVYDPVVNEDSPGAGESPPNRARPGGMRPSHPLRNPVRRVSMIEETGQMTQHDAFWTEAFKTHYLSLCRRVRTHLTKGDAAEAEEISSEAFARAMKYAKYPEAITNLFAHLFVTARRIFILKRRGENSQNMESLEGLVEAGREPKFEFDVHLFMETKEYEAAYKARRGPLTAREETLLKLHLEGYACDEIAAMLSEDRRQTRADLNRVHAKVRYRLAKKEKGQK
jgi:DNA-directed RNA polymerase specialized sigma24 family protein